MGLFDTVWARCPVCNTEQELQTKGGERLLSHYPAYRVPMDAALDLQSSYYYAKDTDGYITCENNECKTQLYITVSRTLTEYVTVTLHQKSEHARIEREQFE